MKTPVSRLHAMLFLLMCSVTSLASAQDYIVEVVLFTQPSSRIVAGPAPELDWKADAAELDSTTRSNVRPIDDSRHRLANEARKLSAQGSRILFHQAWTQPAGTPVAVTKGEDLTGFDLYPVQGVVSLSRDNTLEANVAFWVNHEAASMDSEPVSERLKQSRRLRPDEVHYLDHQSLGMLIIVSR
ncbi:CsiV family protein [Pseudomonas saliphila]|uniref:CsiV family protein n=1 Tax=Pseudomonas saliphila TaxID=2586906 RepID=UPI00123BEAB3|nr:CsiV family protein [Pseudomonas saliphila]